MNRFHPIALISLLRGRLGRFGIALFGRFGDKPAAIRHNAHLVVQVVLPILMASHPEVVLAQSANVGPLLIHVVPPISGTKILPNDTKLPGIPSTELKLTACRGEYEPASFVIRAVASDIEELILEPQDLVGTGTSATIPAENVDIKIVKPWFQSYYAWNEIGKAKPEDFRETLVPELLLNDDGLVVTDAGSEANRVRIGKANKVEYVHVNPKALAPREQEFVALNAFPVRDAATLQPITIAKRTNKQVWVTIRIPESAAPGKYRGRIELRSPSIAAQSIAIELSVPDFNLAESTLTHSIYYRAQLDMTRESVGSETRNAEQMRQELLNLKHHGVTNPTLYQSLASESLFRQALQLRKELEMNRGPLLLIGVQTTESPAALEKAIPRLRRLALEYGFDDLYVYGRDEATGDALRAQRSVWELVHRLGAKVFVAGYTESHAAVGDLLDMLVHAHQPIRREALRWHASGHRIFNYGNPQSGPENPYLFRLNYGVLLWANEYDGAMPYAYQHCFGTCWNDVDHKSYRDHNLTYPTADGVIDTIAWEGFREGVDDTRYLATLEAMLGRQNSAVVASGARAFLQTLRDRVLSLQQASGKYNQKMSLDLDQMRRDLLFHIEALSR